MSLCILIEFNQRLETNLCINYVKMETISTSETPVNLYLTVQSHSLEYVIQRFFTNTAVGMRHADHVTPSICKSWH
jgi:hypothetical protein